MAIIFLDGFEGSDVTTGTASNFATQRYLTRMYEEYNAGWPGTGPELGDGWGTGYAVTMGTDSSADGSYVRKKFDPIATVVFGVAVRIGNGLSATNGDYKSNNIFKIMSRHDFVDHLTINVINGRHLAFYRAGALLGTAQNMFVPGGWSYVELKITINDTTGAITAKCNGETKLTLTNIDTKNGIGGADCDAIEFRGIDGGTGTGESTYFDDIYICDTTGSVNNDFLGPLKIEDLVPTAAGNSTDWSPKTPGNPNYGEVDETPVDFEATYIHSNTTGDKDTYELANLTYIDGTIIGVQVDAVSRLEDAATQYTIAGVIRSSTSESASSGETITVTSYVLQAAHSPFDTDPNGGGAFTVSSINALEAGLEVL